MSFVCGLDLGQMQDFSALAVLERLDKTYAVRHLHRWKLGTPYPVVGSELKALLETPQLRGSLLVVDQTGVGRAVVDSLRVLNLPASMHAVTITAGLAPERDGVNWKVPKRELVGTMRVLLGEGRLKIAPELELADALAKELGNFRVKITASARETFEAWRESDHDDLVLAVALAAWLAERCPALTAASIGRSAPRAASRQPEGFGGDFRRPFRP